MNSRNAAELHRPALNWLNIVFLTSVHLVAVVGTALYLVLHGLTWPALGIAFFWFIACGFSITGGYHRLFSHTSFSARAPLKIFFLFFGAAQFQNSALKWSIDHRRHHRYTDTDGDPYNVKKGFWWAHMGWVFYKEGEGTAVSGDDDLTGDALVMFQHRCYAPLAVFAGFILPAFMGVLLGDLWGALMLAGFARLVILYQATFCVNSVAHYLGRQTYSDRDSSRDSWVTALITLGEGYHNFHHRFPFDYRNGVRTWQYDPTKWGIYLLSRVGLTYKLRRAAHARIVAARLAMRERRRCR